jgi:hypothetical protein
MASEARVYSFAVPHPTVSWGWLYVKFPAIGEVLMMAPNGRPVVVLHPKSGVRYLQTYACECGEKWALIANYERHWLEHH